MKDIAKFNNQKPSHAEGKFCIELKDPVTDKVKERIEGTNHVFKDALFVQDWINYTGNAYLVLNDSTAEINPDLPYVLGQTIGYGQASQEGSGLRRGSYNSANQVLALRTHESTRWKFQYDFTAPQAIGEIGTIGLTHQYSARQATRMDGYTMRGSGLAGGYTQYLSDGRYLYNGYVNDNIVVLDSYTGVENEIDISTFKGGNSIVGCDPVTKKFYIYDYNFYDASLRKLYEFSDNTFSVLENTYDMPVSLASPRPNISAFWIIGQSLFMKTGNTLEMIPNFKNAVEAQAITGLNHNIVGAGSLEFGLIVLEDYAIAMGASGGGAIFDNNKKAFVGALRNTYTSSLYLTGALHPYTTNRLPLTVNSTSGCHAICAKKLDDVVVKTADNAMTATYELEVYW